MQKQYARIVRVGVDLASAVVQVHAVDAAETVVVAKQLARAEFLPWCRRLPEGCVVAMEASCAAHFWARRMAEMGLSPRLIAPAFVTPYRMGGETAKNDANDADAICEAASRPRMRYVLPLTPTQQAWRAIHTLRSGYVIDRSACMNRVRGILAEFGVVFPLSRSKFRDDLLEVLNREGTDVTPLAKTALRRCFKHFQALERQIAWCDKEIERHLKSDRNAKLAHSILGVGVLGASAIAATAGDLRQFSNGRQFSAWLGLVPGSHSTGGKQRLGSISKRGNKYLRLLLVAGAWSVLRAAPKRDDALCRWAVQLKDRVGAPKAAVGIANKNARHLWRLLAHDSQEVS